MTAYVAVFGEMMVFFMSGNSCQFWGSSTGFFDSGGARHVSRMHTQD